MKRWPIIAAALAWATEARADPVSIGALVTGIASWWASIGVVGQALIGIGVALAATGISYLLNGGKVASRAKNETLPSVNVPERDGLLERVRLYGYDTTPGAVFFQKTVTNGSTSNPSIYIQGFVVSEGECDALDSVIINGVRCRIDSFGLPLDAPWFDGSVTYFKVSFRPGTDTQAIDPIIAARFPSPPDDFWPDAADRVTRWAQFRQRGVCTVVMEMAFGTSADQHNILWGAGGIPQLLFRIRGLKIYDPRDPAQAVDTKSTWKWSDNATIVETDWLRSEMGFGIAPSSINWAEISNSADVDDISIVTLSGTEANGRCNGRAFGSESNADVMDAMSQQNRALIRRADGLWKITSRLEAKEPVMTIHQDYLVGDMTYQNEPDTRAAINRVAVQFQPASRYNQSAEISYEDVGLIVSDGETYELRASQRFNDSPAFAQRFGYTLVTENRDARTLAMACDIATYFAPGKANKHIEKGDVVRVYMRDYQAINGLYTIDDFKLMTNFVIQFSLTGYNPEMITGWSVNLEKPFAEVA